MEILGYKFVLTCGRSPEQYDIFDGEKQVGYARLRHGYFAVYVDAGDDDTVFDTGSAYGADEFKPWEREFFLAQAAMSLQKFYRLVEAFNAAHQGA